MPPVGGKFRRLYAAKPPLGGFGGAEPPKNSGGVWGTRSPPQQCGPWQGATATRDADDTQWLQGPALGGWRLGAVRGARRDTACSELLGYMIQSEALVIFSKVCKTTFDQNTKRLRQLYSLEEACEE